MKIRSFGLVALVALALLASAPKVEAQVQAQAAPVVSKSQYTVIAPRQDHQIFGINEVSYFGADWVSEWGKLKMPYGAAYWLDKPGVAAKREDVPSIYFHSSPFGDAFTGATYTESPADQQTSVFFPTRTEHLSKQFSLTGINNDGTVSGSYDDPATGKHYLFRRNFGANGSTEMMEHAGWTVGIGDNGIVPFNQLTNPQGGELATMAKLWRTGTMVQVIGQGLVKDVNPSGNMLCGRYMGKVAIWRSNASTVTFPRAGDDAFALDINDHGQAVGFSRKTVNGKSTMTALIYQIKNERPVFTDLNKALPIPKGWRAANCWDINNQGDMVVTLERKKPLTTGSNTQTLIYLHR